MLCSPSRAPPDLVHLVARKVFFEQLLVAWRAENVDADTGPDPGLVQGAPTGPNNAPLAVGAASARAFSIALAVARDVSPGHLRRCAPLAAAMLCPARVIRGRGKSCCSSPKKLPISIAHAICEIVVAGVMVDCGLQNPRHSRSRFT